MNSQAIQTQALTVLKAAKEIPDLANIVGFSAEYTHFMQRLSDTEFRIAVVGEFSSGKSTFINALLGRDVLKHATTETTAALTKIINIPETDARCGSSVVHFRNGSDQPIRDFIQLKDFTTTESASHQVVEEIASVELYLPVLPSTKQICIVDTPGLNGIADGHREQTIQLIQQAHACIYLLQRRGLSESDIAFLKYICRFQKNFIFVQNFIDELLASEGETPEKKIGEQRVLLEQNLLPEYPDIQYQVCGVSALLELAAKDKSMDYLYADSKQKLTDQDRTDCHARSRFDALYTLLQQVFADDKLSAIQYGDTARAMQDWLDELAVSIQRRATQAEEVYETSQEHLAAEKMQRLIQKIETSKPAHQKNLENFVTKKMDEFRRAEEPIIREAIEKLKAEAGREIQRCEQPDDLDAAFARIKRKVNSGVTDIESTETDDMQSYVNNVYRLLTDRIEEYSGIKSEGLSLSDLTITLPRMQTQFAAETEISRLEESIRHQQSQLQSVQQEKNRSSREIEDRRADAQRQIRQQKETKEQVEREREDKLRRQGARPDVKTREESYTTYEKRRGFFGGIVNFFCGDKKVTHWRTVTDDSEQQKWDNKRRRINNEAAEKLDELEDQIEATERLLRTLQESKRTNEQQFERKQAYIESRIRDLKRSQEEARETLEQEKKQALKELMQTAKKGIINQINDYLDQAFTQMCQNMESSLQQIQQEFHKLVSQMYEQAVQNKLGNIRAMGNKNPSELQQRIQDLKGTLQKLKALRQQLEGILV